MNACCTLPDVRDIDAVQNVNGSDSEAGLVTVYALPLLDDCRHSFERFSGGFVLNRSISRRCQAAGFTFIEMLLVFVIMGIMLSITVKSVRGTWVASSRRSASREVTAYLFRARTIAIQQSRTAWLVRSGNVLKILVDSSGTPVQLRTQIDMSQRYGATLGASPKDTIQFDPRGFVANVAQTPKLTVQIGAATDTLCVTGLGRITTRSCP